MAIEKKSIAGLLPGSGRLDRALRIISAVILFVMMALVFFDVFARYLFAAPIRGAFEITELLMGALIFAALPLATAGEHHITIGLMDRWFTGRAHQIRLIILRAIAGLAFFGLAAVMLMEANNFAYWGDYTAHLKIPIAPLCYFMALMSALSGIISMALVVYYIRHPDDPGTPQREDTGE